MCKGVKFAFIYVAVACGVRIGQPLHASALGGGRVLS